MYIYVCRALDMENFSCSKILIWHSIPLGCGYSKESSHWDDSFEYPQHRIWLSIVGKRPVHSLIYFSVYVKMSLNKIPSIELRVKNNMVKEEISHFDQFYLLYQCFQKISDVDASRCAYKLESVGSFTNWQWMILVKDGRARLLLRNWKISELDNRWIILKPFHMKFILLIVISNFT